MLKLKEEDPLIFFCISDVPHTNIELLFSATTVDIYIYIYIDIYNCTLVAFLLLTLSPWQHVRKQEVRIVLLEKTAEINGFLSVFICMDGDSQCVCVHVHSCSASAESVNISGSFSFDLYMTQGLRLGINLAERNSCCVINSSGISENVFSSLKKHFSLKSALRCVFRCL